MVSLEYSLTKINPAGIFPSFTLQEKELKHKEILIGLDDFKTIALVFLY